MESRGIYANISPLDHRYSQTDPALFEALSAVLSEEASLRYCVRVEAALVRALAAHGVGPRLTAADEAALAALEGSISPEEVYEEERKTQHNVRALVNVIQRHLPAGVGPLVHLGATSVDILDTAFALRVRDAVRGVVLPLLLDLETELARRTREEADTPQIGRTHGQHAVPITFGFALASTVSRLGKSIGRLHAKGEGLRGKLAGAVGCYSATSLLVADPLGLEKDHLAGLGLEPSECSTQLAEPEPLLEVLLEMNTAFGIIANLADDLRHLQRSEIGEVREEFRDAQVGSSTMPQKRNPWNSEHVKSLWKAFAPRVVSFFMDQISEHQRDLTNSASQRFVADYIAGFAAAASRMLGVMRGLGVRRERMTLNLRTAGDLVFSEALYILIATGGEADAHERVRRATLQAERSGEPLIGILQADPVLWRALTEGLAKAGGVDPAAFFSDPAHYRGRAAEKARAVADKYEAAAAAIRRGLAG
jgi:adenylosuccinate lyase